MKYSDIYDRFIKFDLNSCYMNWKEVFVKFQIRNLFSCHMPIKADQERKWRKSKAFGETSNKMKLTHSQVLISCQALDHRCSLMYDWIFSERLTLRMPMWTITIAQGCARTKTYAKDFGCILEFYEEWRCMKAMEGLSSKCFVKYFSHPFIVDVSCHYRTTKKRTTSKSRKCVYIIV